MDISNFDYHLPPSLIAHKPLTKRDHSKILIINRSTNEISDKHFYNLYDFLDSNDVLVLNNTKVFPARFFGKKNSKGKVEILLTKPLNNHTWEVLTKPGVEVGQEIMFEGFCGTVTNKGSQTVNIKFSLSTSELMSKLTKIGITPLPPYIHSTQTEPLIKKEYQTIYAQKVGSVAAPTAGFHFTKPLLNKLIKKGIQIEYVTLHVGLGTFAPVKTKTLRDHPMHSEYFELSPKVANNLNKAKERKKRIIAVGTTTTRVLESCTNTKGVLVSQKGQTNIFIYPPYKFKFVNGLITNFHLPKSTLICLVSAFCSYPNTKQKFSNFESSLVGLGYKRAINKKYRFYSFGDSCLIV